MLRLRRENGVPIVIHEDAGDDPSYRNEWECKAVNPKLAVPKLIELGAPEELATIEKFQTLCSAHFTRTAVTLSAPGCHGGAGLRPRRADRRLQDHPHL